LVYHTLIGPAYAAQHQQGPMHPAPNDAAHPANLSIDPLEPTLPNAPATYDLLHQ